MNICVTVNSKYMRYLYIMLLSLYESNIESDITLYVIQRDFTNDDKKAIKLLTEQYGNKVYFIWIDPHKFDNMPKSLEKRSNLSLEIYFRLLIPELLPADVDRALMLDVDIVVNKPIMDLYNMDFNGKCLGAAPNMCHNFLIEEEWKKWYDSDRTNWTHYNTGILMWNLKRIREKFPVEHIFNLAWKYKIETATFEEELFNVAFGENEIMELDASKWNYISTHDDRFQNPRFHRYETYDELKKECAIIHYAALNPWHGGRKNQSFQLWWEYAKKSPYYYKILEESYANCEKVVGQMQKSIDNQEKKLVFIERLLDRENRSRFISNLKALNASRIIIYGAGRVGRCIDAVLSDTDIEILCFIDKAYRNTFCGKQTVGFDRISDYEKNADLILVSVSYYFEEIEQEIKSFTDCRLVALDEVI